MASHHESPSVFYRGACVRCRAAMRPQPGALCDDCRADDAAQAAAYEARRWYTPSPRPTPEHVTDQALARTLRQLVAGDVERTTEEESRT